MMISFSFWWNHPTFKELSFDFENVFWLSNWSIKLFFLKNNQKSGWLKWLIEKLLTRLSGKEEYCPQTWASDEKFDKLETLVKLDKLDKLDTLVKLDKLDTLVKLDMVDERGSDEWSREAAELAAAAIFNKKKKISAIWQKTKSSCLGPKVSCLEKIHLKT